MAESFDTIVVGAGIHGAGIAQALCAEGYSVLALEQAEIAHGTSSRSSKLVHGGLRYLERGRIGLVRESLREREILLRIAPGLVHLEPFFVPVYADTVRRPSRIRLGLVLYALLAGLRPDARFRSVPEAEWPELDGLSTEGLQRVYRYFDAQTDDAALTRAVMRSACELGCVLQQPARFRSAERRGREGWRVFYEFEGHEQEARGLALVNAAGPWANRVLERIPEARTLGVDLVQGAHLVVDRPTRKGIYYAEAPRDARPVFVMPWRGGTLVGTTETPFSGDPECVRALPGELAYLEETFRRYFPGDGDVTGSFAGLRVLPRGEGGYSDRSRETVLFPDDRKEPRLLTVYGGKLTAYRATARKAVRILEHVLPPRDLVVDTSELALPVEGGP